jgi:hypothetical protein
MEMRMICAALLAVLLPAAAWAAKDEPTKVPPGTPVTITVKPAEASAPPATISLLARHGHVTPVRAGFTHTGSGYIDIQQPTPDVLVVTMTGVAVAGGHPCKNSSASMDFDLEQCIEISFEKADLKAVKLSLEARVIGLLRSECGCTGKASGSAEESGGCATVGGEAGELLTVGAPGHAVAGGESLSVNCHDGPVSATVAKAGKYTLHQTFHIAAAHGQSLLGGKAASAEFAPDPALDPLWISYWEPFHGVGKKDFGLQVTLRVAEDTNPPEPVKAPTPEGK